MSGSYLTCAARRVAAAVLIAVIVSAITFVMLRVLRPESFVGERALPIETLDFLRGAFLHFDLGNSRQPPFRPVSEMILEGLPADFSLFASGVGRLVELPIFDTGNYRHLTEDPVVWLESLLVHWMVAGRRWRRSPGRTRRRWPGTRCWWSRSSTSGGLPRQPGRRGNLAADLLMGRLDPRVRAQ